MKTILCFTANMGAGGAEHQLAILANFLFERGYHVQVVTYNDEGEDHYYLNHGIERIRLRVNGNVLNKEWYIARFLWKQSPSCIISYRIVQNFILLLPMFFHKVSKIIVSERNLTQKPSLKEKIAHSILYKKADWIVPNSYSQGRYLMSLQKSWKGRIVTITNYTDKSKFVQSPLPESDKIQIGVFASIQPAKNYVNFCLMLAKLRNKATRKFEIHWYGEKQGPFYQEHTDKIHALIKEYNLEDVIKIYAPVKNVCEYMPMFHAMCLPSLYEGFSNSLSEYICSGKPVLASDVSDNSLMCHNGENGFLFDPHSVDSMSNAFLNFLSLDRSEMIEMGTKSRMIAERLFDKDKFINSYIDLIEN